MVQSWGLQIPLYILTRNEDMCITGHRHESVVDYNVLADKTTGKIQQTKFKAFAKL